MCIYICVKVVLINILVSQLGPKQKFMTPICFLVFVFDRFSVICNLYKTCYLCFYAKNLSPNLGGIYKSQPNVLFFREAQPKHSDVVFHFFLFCFCFLFFSHWNGRRICFLNVIRCGSPWVGWRGREIIFYSNRWPRQLIIRN